LLDIVEINNALNNGKGYQSENTIFDDNSLNPVGSLDISILDDLCDNGRLNLIFGNRGKALPEDVIQRMNHSLMLVKVGDFEIIERKYEGREHPQIRLSFEYNNDQYDLPITDPVFLKKYAKNSKLLNDKKEIYIVLSLGVPHKDWYYKLVAGIIY